MEYFQWTIIYPQIYRFYGCDCVNLQKIHLIFYNILIVMITLVMIEITYVDSLHVPIFFLHLGIAILIIESFVLTLFLVYQLVH